MFWKFIWKSFVFQTGVCPLSYILLSLKQNFIHQVSIKLPKRHWDYILKTVINHVNAVLVQIPVKKKSDGMIFFFIKKKTNQWKQNRRLKFSPGGVDNIRRSRGHSKEIKSTDGRRELTSRTDVGVPFIGHHCVILDDVIAMVMVLWRHAHVKSNLKTGQI